MGDVFYLPLSLSPSFRKQEKSRKLGIRFCHILFILLAVACNNQTSVKVPEAPINPMARKIDSIRYLMPNVNAGCMIYIDTNGQIFRKLWGKNVSSDAVCDTTIFEGASLSKTVTAYIFWQMVKDNTIRSYNVRLPSCRGNGSANVNLLRLLSHSAKSTDKCLIDSKHDTFKYSEDNYLLLQHYLETISGKSLEALAQHYVFGPLKMQHSTFIWNDSITDYVDGYFQDFKKHRNIYRFKQAASNGSLYTCATDLIKFSKALLGSDVTDSICKQLKPVHHYRQLFWGQGMGIDSSMNSNLLWQWGCNWSYNHILLIDKKKKDIVIGLTNSIIGAKRLRFASNYLKGSELELFNYINWY